MMLRTFALLPNIRHEESERRLNGFHKSLAVYRNWLKP